MIDNQNAKDQLKKEEATDDQSKQNYQQQSQDQAGYVESQTSPEVTQRVVNKDDLEGNQASVDVPSEVTA